MLFIIYSLFSALQIKHGLYDSRRKSLLMKGNNIIYSSLFKGYLAMPFLYELKLTLDYTFTNTALDLFKWLKFEQIYDLLFITDCYIKSEKDRRIDESVSFLEKLIGGLAFLILVIILFGPLLLFSSLNPTNKVNNVSGAKVNVRSNNLTYFYI